MRREDCLKSYWQAAQRKKQRARRRKKAQIRLLALGAPLLALAMLAGGAALAALTGNGPQAAGQVQSTLPAIGTPAPASSPASGPADAPVPQAPESAPTQPPPATEWNLLLVNPWNSLPEGFEVTLTQLKNGHAVDERCYPDLQQMMDDCRAAGLSPLICSSYRTWEKQQQLFNNRVNALLAQGYAEADARAEAGKAVAVPGTSEHQLGLAVDIVDVNNQNLNESQEKTPVQQWLMQNSWRYGFILRYPSDKCQLTGIMYEPWHYRYVGKEAARYIHENSLCLEEYLQQLA